MNADSGFLYQHLAASTQTLISDSVTETRLFVALARLAAVGFVVDTDGQRLKVTPARLLSSAQRDWLRKNKPALVAAVSTPFARWCIEYPRSLVAADSGTRCVVDYLPEADWRTVARDYFGAAVWPAPDNLDVAGWIDAGRWEGRRGSLVQRHRFRRTG